MLDTTVKRLSVLKALEQKALCCVKRALYVVKRALCCVMLWTTVKRLSAVKRLSKSDDSRRRALSVQFTKSRRALQQKDF